MISTHVRIRFAPSLACALVGLVACARHPLNPGTGEGDADVRSSSGADAGIEVSSPSGADADDDASPLPGADAATDASPSDDAQTAVDAAMYFRPDAPLWNDNCVGSLPGSYVSFCSACHTQRGPANPRYPDLFAYKGSEADFVTVVRGGRNTMPAYSAGVISDGDLGAIFRYFTDGTFSRQGLDAVDLGSVQPLFSPADAKNPPIVFKRDDGVLVTRAAGRIRGRHEKEPSFGTYPIDYFADGTYGFTIEDATVVGRQSFRVTYLPVFAPGKTNWRSWKVSGDNSTFMQNDYLLDIAAPPFAPTAPFAAVQQFDETRVPSVRTSAVGENFEFEFGIFLAMGPPRRNQFYSDTFRYRIGLGGLTANNRDYPALAGPLLGAQLGGDTTIGWLVAEPDMYFDQPALDVQHENVQRFVEGRRLFFTDFTTGANLETSNSPFPAQADKAGPLFNARSCETCHLKNGGGSLVNGAFGEKASVELKLFGAGALGHQLQIQEGSAAVASLQSKTVMFPDGEMVVLRWPTFAVVAGGGDVTHFSPRVARPLVGLGLLEAIDERSLASRSDRFDCDKNGISGRPNLVRDPVTGVLRVGRFGWKAEKVSVAHQVADDAAESLGVTTSLFPDAQGKAELSDADLARLTTYMRLIGVPPQRNADDPRVRAGEQIFETIGCGSCHATDVVTSPNHPFSELRGQAIKPYTDLLLHDMGPDLADSSGLGPSEAPGDPPTSAEWRTPPLWGVGLAKTVNPDAALLHDGRAADVQEAILWHGGEAAKIRAAFVALSTGDRAALLAFVQSL
jgi:CxxC motif-containing protein (DUF1111 family)